RARSRVDPAPEEGCRDAGVRVTELRLEERLPETSVAAEAGARREELLARHRIELVPVARLLEDAEAEPHLEPLVCQIRSAPRPSSSMNRTMCRSERKR